MLAAAGDYLKVWQLPVFLAAMLAWFWGGTHLLRRAIRDQVSRKVGTFQRCLLVTVLAGACGAFGGGVVFFLILSIGQASGIHLHWLEVIAAIAVFAATSYVVLFASLELSRRQVLQIWARSYAGPIAVMAVLIVPTAWISYAVGQADIDRALCRIRLQNLHTALVNSYPGRPPRDLQQLADDNVIRADQLRCPAVEEYDKGIAYFYIPMPANRNRERMTDPILACDFRGNHSGGRGVVFANGRVEWYAEADFQKLLAEPRNANFAAALRKAEAARKGK